MRKQLLILGVGVFMLSSCTEKNLISSDDREEMRSLVQNVVQNQPAVVEKPSIVVTEQKEILFNKKDERYNLDYKIETITTGMNWLDSFLLDRWAMQVSNGGQSNNRTLIANFYDRQFAKEKEEARSLFSSRKRVLPTEFADQLHRFYEIKHQHQHIITITDTLSRYTGGAHGMWHIDYLNFDLKNQRPITLDTLFSDSELVKQRLFEKLRSQKSDEFFYYAQNYKNFRMPEDFYLTKEGIHFVYQLYEIGSYSEGNKTLTLSWQSINSLLREGVSQEQLGF